MLKPLSEEDFVKKDNKSKIRKMITACTKLNTVLMLLRMKDCFINYVYSTHIDVYSDRFERSRAFERLFTTYKCYRDNYGVRGEYIFFKEILVCWKDLSNHQKELLTRVGNSIFYGYE